MGYPCHRCTHAIGVPMPNPNLNLFNSVILRILFIFYFPFRPQRRFLPKAYGEAMFKDKELKSLIDVGKTPRKENFKQFLSDHPIPEGFTWAFLQEKCKTKVKQKKKREEKRREKTKMAQKETPKKTMKVKKSKK